MRRDWGSVRCEANGAIHYAAAAQRARDNGNARRAEELETAAAECAVVAEIRARRAYRRPVDMQLEALEKLRARAAT